ncbi:MAG: hypothetical protein AB8B91_18475 [Rubripirellula sp.]
MKVISLNCNHCGAPLDAPLKAKFITCSFCEARLAVQRTGSSYSTELLEELHETTQTLARDVAQIKTGTSIESLDRSWEIERAEYMVQGKHGRVSKPTKGTAVLVGVVMGGFGLFWTVMTLGITGAGSRMGAPGFIKLFPLFGVLFIGVAIFQAVNIFGKAEAYERAQARYQEKRRELMRE